MDGFANIFLDWHFWAVIIVWYMIMAVISGMPEPDATSSKGYQWAFNSLHIFAANIKQVVGNKIPGAVTTTTGTITTTTTGTTTEDAPKSKSATNGGQ